MNRFNIIKEGNELVGEGIIKEDKPGAFKVDLICEGSDAHFRGLSSEKAAVDRVMKHLYEMFAHPNGEAYSIH